MVSNWVSGPVVLVGDFNLIVADMEDVASPPHGILFVFGWELATTLIKFGSCIDHMFVSGMLSPSISYPRLTLESWSPHLMLRAEMLARPRALLGDTLVVLAALPRQLSGAPAPDTPESANRWRQSSEAAKQSVLENLMTRNALMHSIHM